MSALVSTGRFEDQVARILELGRQQRSSYVCCVNAHMVAEAWRDPAFNRVVNKADLALPDGMPVVRMLFMLYGVRQERVAGNDLLPAVVAGAEEFGLSVYLYGATEEVLDRIQARFEGDHPELHLAGAYSPPFRPLTEDELERDADRIRLSQANIVLVSLGCPRQERWMAMMNGKIDAVMLGIGGAFPLYAGVDSRAPELVRRLSLEWVYRLVHEPRRLWKRYLVTNTIFIGLSLRSLIGRAVSGHRADPEQGGRPEDT